MSSVRDTFGLACPACQSDERLQVQVTTTADLSTDGSEPTSDHGWHDGSFICCRACNHTGTVKAFTAACERVSRKWECGDYWGMALDFALEAAAEYAAQDGVTLEDEDQNLPAIATEPEGEPAHA